MRKQGDLEAIAKFLSNFPEISLLNKNISQHNYRSTLLKMSEQMVYSLYEKNKVIFITGDFGESCYILLKGKVAVLIPIRETVLMSRQEYYCYLANLLKYDEIELYNRCIHENSHIFPVEFQSKDLLKNIQIRLKEILKESRNQEKKTIIYDFIGEYINRIKPIFSSSSQEDNVESSKVEKGGKDEELHNNHKEKVTIYEYHYDFYFKTGQFFGHYALETNSKKRTATVIALEDCHLGLFTQESYDNLIKSIVDLAKEENLELLCSCKIFINHKKNVFGKLYYHKFIPMNYPRNSKVFNEGDEKLYIYFVKEGDFLLKFNKSLFEIGEIIKILKGESYVDPWTHKHECEDKEVYRIMNEKRNFNITIAQKIDCLGLIDLIDGNKYWYTLECLTNKNEIFKVKFEVN